MRYSIEPKNRIYVKGYGFLSFAKKMGTNWSNRYDQKLRDSPKKSTTDAIKSASKRAIKKKPEATGYLIGKKIADKITNFSKNPSKKLNSVELHSQNNKANDEWKIPKERYVSPEKRQQIIDELRSV